VLILRNKKPRNKPKSHSIEKIGAQSILASQRPNASNGAYEHALLLAAQAFKEKESKESKVNSGDLLLRVLQAKTQQIFF